MNSLTLHSAGLTSWSRKLMCFLKHNPTTGSLSEHEHSKEHLHIDSLFELQRKSKNRCECSKNPSFHQKPQDAPRPEVHRGGNTSRTNSVLLPLSIEAHLPSSFRSSNVSRNSRTKSPVMGRKGNTSMNTNTDEPLPNPDLELRIRLAALDRHNKELDARSWRAVLTIIVALTAACAGAAFLLR